jgi:hypothetical protein
MFVDLMVEKDATRAVEAVRGAGEEGRPQSSFARRLT